MFRDYNLKFTPLMVKNTFAYLWKTHPLADKEILSLEELSDYPCISFDQNSESEYYLTEEALGNYDFSKLIKSNDRATTAELMASLNGYSIGTGHFTQSIALTDGFVSIKLKEEDPLTIGYITGAGRILSEIGQTYIEELLKYQE